jgi:hypothetical protein
VPRGQPSQPKHLRIRFCALRFLHFKVLATLAAVVNSSASHPIFYGMGFAPSNPLWRSTWTY